MKIKKIIWTFIFSHTSMKMSKWTLLLIMHARTAEKLCDNGHTKKSRSLENYSDSKEIRYILSLVEDDIKVDLFIDLAHKNS